MPITFSKHDINVIASKDATMIIQSVGMFVAGLNRRFRRIVFKTTKLILIKFYLSRELHLLSEDYLVAELVDAFLIQGYSKLSDSENEFVGKWVHALTDFFHEHDCGSLPNRTLH